jgi:hypothetical protein
LWSPLKWKKDFPQCLHTKGISPVWLLSWQLSNLESFKAFLEHLHWSDFSPALWYSSALGPLWVIKGRLRDKCLMKTCLHTQLSLSSTPLGLLLLIIWSGVWLKTSPHRISLFSQSIPTTCPLRFLLWFKHIYSVVWYFSTEARFLKVSIITSLYSFCSFIQLHPLLQGKRDTQRKQTLFPSFPVILTLSLCSCNHWVTEVPKQGYQGPFLYQTWV